MTSWANRGVNLQKKLERNISVFYEPTSDDFAKNTLHFLYGFAYSQRSAESYYIKDTYRQFQPYLKVSPILHYLKESPASGSNLDTDLSGMAPVLNSLTLSSLRRTLGSIYQWNGQTEAKIEQFISNFGPLKQVFDVGIVLDASESVSEVIAGLQSLQKRTGKKTMKIFVSTDSLDVLREFAALGDKTWSYSSFLRFEPPKDAEAVLLKKMAELKVLQTIEYLVCRLRSPYGKLLYLTSKILQMESQVINLDKTSWKAVE